MGVINSEDKKCDCICTSRESHIIPVYSTTLGLSSKQDIEHGEKGFQVALSAGLPAVLCVVSQNFFSFTYSLPSGLYDPSRARAGCKGQPQMGNRPDSCQ